MEVNWFPGHMTKALRDMKARLSLVDLVIEVCDARIPLSSRNPEVAKLIRDKKKLLVFTKNDMADPIYTDVWKCFYKQQGINSVAVCSFQNKACQQIYDLSREAVSEKLERAAEKGRIGRPVRAMIVGIPNVGKSTLINAMAGRKAAVTSDRPGVTRAPQWIRTGGIELMDMPGVLWPKISDKDSQLVLAATGAVRDQVLDVEEISYLTFWKIAEYYPKLLCERYKLDSLDGDQYEVYGMAAKKRGCIMSGGRIDYLRFATLFLDELRGGKIGRITLERP